MKETGEMNNQNTANFVGVSVTQCKAVTHCPKAIDGTEQMAKRVNDLVHSVGLDALVREKFGDKPAKHHVFSIVFSGCPNGCSRPQIQDVGIMATARVAVNQQSCVACMRCVSACKENAIFFNGRTIVIDQEACIGCGDCVRACPASAITKIETGYRILAGGRLGRHPRLADEIYSFVTEDQVVGIVEKIICYFRDFTKRNERLADVLARNGVAELRKYIEKA